MRRSSLDDNVESTLLLLHIFRQNEYSICTVRSLSRINKISISLKKKTLLVLRYQRPITYKASSAFFEYGWNSIIGMENKISSLWIVCVQILIVKCVVHVNFPLIKAASVMCEVSLSQYTAWMDWQVGYISVL